ncbi:MAG: ADP-ribosylglycohydrolase family protein [Thermodesulfobacteriota bacterium]
MIPPDILRDKFKGTILGCFLGDAFGAGFEGMAHDRIRNHPRFVSETFSGRHTDDTDMTLALAESIVKCGKVDPEDIAKQFSLYCDLTRGYAIGTIKAVLALRAGLPWHQVGRIVFENGSFGNGAAMRVSPVGLFYHHDLDELQEAAIKQATVTHVHPLGQWGAVMQASSVGLAVPKNPEEPFQTDEVIVGLRDLLRFGPTEYLRALDEIEKMLIQGSKPGIQEMVQRLGNGVEAHLSVPSASYIAFAHSPNFRMAIHASVSLGGDTDTIAAMVGAIVGAHVGEKGLPIGWVNQLEDGPRGRSFARDLSERLFDTWWRVHKTVDES